MKAARWQPGTLGEIIFGLCDFSSEGLAQVSGYYHSTIIRTARRLPDEPGTQCRVGTEHKAIRMYAAINRRLGWRPGEDLLCPPSRWGTLGLDEDVRNFLEPLDLSRATATDWLTRHRSPEQSQHLIESRKEYRASALEAADQSRDVTIEVQRLRKEAVDRVRMGAAFPEDRAGVHRMLCEVYKVPKDPHALQVWYRYRYPYLSQVVPSAVACGFILEEAA